MSHLLLSESHESSLWFGSGDNTKERRKRKGNAGILCIFVCDGVVKCILSIDEGVQHGRRKLISNKSTEKNELRQGHTVCVQRRP